MNMPGFTAVAALYKTSGHYQTNRNRINLPTQMVGTIYAAEVIEVHGCRPGHTMVGTGDDFECFPDPLTEPPGGGEFPDPPPVGPNDPPGGGFSGTGGKKSPPKKRPPREDFDKPDKATGCSPNQVVSNAAKPCLDQQEKDIHDGVEQPHLLKCTGSRKGKVAHPKMECCQTDGDVTVCDELN